MLSLEPNGTIESIGLLSEPLSINRVERLAACPLVAVLPKERTRRMEKSGYRKRILHRPPCLSDGQNRFAFLPSTRKPRGKWDEEIVATRIVTNRARCRR